MRTVEELFTHFDDIVVNGSDDELFASSYLRDFINLAVLELDQCEQLTHRLFDTVMTNVKAAKAELSPQDQLIVNQFWSELANHFQ